jgi:hypothetical protein
VRGARAPRARDQSGQAIVLIAVAMVAVLTISALVISAGELYWQRRQEQELADAAALAGAAMVPCSGQNAYAAIDGVVSAQLGVSPVLTQTPGPCGSSAPSWSRTYPDGTSLTATFPYTDPSHVQVSVVSPQVQLPMGGLLGVTQSTVAARAVARSGAGSPPALYALYVRGNLGCGGTTSTNIFGSVYVGGTIDTNCSMYVHVLRNGSGALIDQGDVLVFTSGQQWSRGGGSCALGEASGNATCGDGFEISGSACPAPTGITDYLGTSRLEYPCPSFSVPAPTFTPYTPPEPNADVNALATIGGTPCDPNGMASAYPPLKIGTTAVARMRPTGSYQPVKDLAGYYHFKPGCYGWLDVSLVPAADPLAQPVVIFDPGFYYFSGYFQSADKSGGSGPQTAGGLCLNNGTRAVGKDVLFEFTSNLDPSSLSSSSCDDAPTSTTSSGFGADPLVPIVDAGVTYGYLSAPCDPSTNLQCPLPSGSAWCPKTDRGCNATLIWAPAGPPTTPTLPAIDGSFYVKGPTETSWLYGGVFWPGAAAGSPGCSWTANGTAAIVGQIVCDSVLLQGGSSSTGSGITYARTATNTAAAQAALTE